MAITVRSEPGRSQGLELLSGSPIWDAGAQVLGLSIGLLRCLTDSWTDTKWKSCNSNQCSPGDAETAGSSSTCHCTGPCYSARAPDMRFPWLGFVFLNMKVCSLQIIRLLCSFVFLKLLCYLISIGRASYSFDSCD